MAFATKPKPKQTPAHKKRSGTHRKHNQQYLKHYWPYLPLLAIVAGGLLLNAFWSSGSAVMGARTDLTTASLLADTNEVRTANGDSTLVLNDRLNQAAQAKARDMAARNYWSHNTPDGRTPWSFIADAGYNYAAAGENLAYGFTDATTTVNAWMHSPEHRRNLLDRNYSQVGFGIVDAPNYRGEGDKIIIVAMYAQPSAAAIPVFSASGVGDVKGARFAGLPVSRFATMRNLNTELMSMLLIGATGLAAGIFITRHARLLHRSLVRGEAFVLHHPLFDVVIVSIATAGCILSQTAGFVL